MQKIRTLILSIAIPLLVGGLSGLLTSGSVEQYKRLILPPFAPSEILFPVVWNLLYILMGIAAFLIYTSDADSEDKKKALRLYGLQLFLNFLWPILFFNFQLYLPAFFLLILLLFAVLLLIQEAYSIDPRAAGLLVPYAAWLTFAGYLNLAIYMLNK